MIEPTVGRIVWLHGARGISHDRTKPFGARVVYVWDDRLINVAYEDHIGQHLTLSLVVLLQDDDPKPEDGPFCVWVPLKR